MKKRTKRNLDTATKFFAQQPDLEVRGRLGENDYNHCSICVRPPKKNRLSIFYIYSWNHQDRFGGDNILVCEKCHHEIQDALHALSHVEDAKSFQEELKAFQSKITHKKGDI